MRNPCNECDYYHKENNTCQSKKCCTGGDGTVTIIDRMFCSPYKYEADRKTEQADRPQGEWIYCEDEYGIDGYKCSNCGGHIPWDYQHKFINFIDDYHTCPFCDARMKGADNEFKNFDNGYWICPECGLRVLIAEKMKRSR